MRRTWTVYTVSPIYNHADPLWAYYRWDKDKRKWTEYNDYLDSSYCFERHVKTAKKARGLRDYLLQNMDNFKLVQVEVYRHVYYLDSWGEVRTLEFSGWAYAPRRQKSLLKRKSHY